MKTKILKILFLLFGLTLLSSCSWIQGHVDNEEVKELNEDMRAGKRKTVMEDSLISLGHMIQGYGYEQTPIQCKNIGNKTADKSIPTDLYMMMATAMNKIGNPVLFIPYDAQYIIAESVVGATMIQRIYPVAVIAGGITGINKDMIEKDRSGDMSGGWAGASGEVRYEASGSVTRVTLDLNMLEYKTMAYFPGVLSSSTAVFEKGKLGWGVAAYYMDFGISLDSTVKKNPTIYAALRILVELGTLEVLGKYFEVPYWRCIKGAKEDTEFIIRVKDNFNIASDEEQVKKLKTMLFLHGYEGMDREKNEFDRGEDHVLSKAMRTNNADNYADLYIALWKTVNVDAGRKRLQIQEKYKNLKRKIEVKRKNMEDSKKQQRQLEEEKEKQDKQLEKEKRYIALVNDGNKLYSEGKFEDAIIKYSNALKISPNDKLKERINNIKRQINAEINKKKRYEKIIDNADALFKKQKYEEALNAYNEALQMKPNDKYPTGQITKINKLNKHKQVNSLGSMSEDEWGVD
jgi:tetratricopeptide (TPR) repeat protein